MFQMTKKIYDVLMQEDLKVFTEEDETRSAVWLSFGIDNGGSYRIKFVSTDDDNDVAVRIFGLISVNDEQKPAILNAINELNAKYRFIKICCDEDGDVNVEYDFPTDCSHPEDSAKEILIRFVRFVDEAYPILMRALWS